MSTTPEQLRQSGPPQHAGELRLQDLKGTVSIVRDEHGVPHIEAESEHDLWFAQGFCHGQDRLWQLERFRRFARGTLSEILGEALIPVDRFYRRLGVQRHSERDWPLLGGEARKILRWFSDGVNRGDRIVRRAAAGVSGAWHSARVVVAGRQHRDLAGDHVHADVAARDQALRGRGARPLWGGGGLAAAARLPAGLAGDRSDGRDGLRRWRATGLHDRRGEQGRGADA